MDREGILKKKEKKKEKSDLLRYIYCHRHYGSK